METAIIISARLKDWQAIQALESRCFGSVDLFKPHQLRHLLSSPTCRSIIAKKNEAIAGYAVGLLRNFRVPSGRVYKISVDPASRGKGLAIRLLKVLEEEFKKVGFTKCCAETRVSNVTSQNLFFKCGYEQKEVLPAYYDDGEDALKFWKSLK